MQFLFVGLSVFVVAIVHASILFAVCISPIFFLLLSALCFKSACGLSRALNLYYVFRCVSDTLSHQTIKQII